MFRKLALCTATAATLTAATAGFAANADTISHPASGYTQEKTLAQLPRNVIPTDYVVTLTPSVDTMRMAGSETVTLLFTEATDKIQFNSSSQKLAHVLLDGATVQSVQTSENSQLTTIKLKAPATIGQHTLSFAFVGQIASEYHGIFTQPVAAHHAAKGMFLTAQFDGIDTHRIFPCWDDPAFIASYQLNVTVPTVWTAWSSMPVQQQDVQGEFTTISYQKTANLRSELVEFSNVHRMQVPENYVGKN